MILDNEAILVCVMVNGNIPFDSYSDDVLHTMDTNYVSGSQRNLSKAIYPQFVVNDVFWLSNKDLEFLDKQNCIGEYYNKDSGRYFNTYK